MFGGVINVVEDDSFFNGIASRDGYDSSIVAWMFSAWYAHTTSHKKLWGINPEVDPVHLCAQLGVAPTWMYHV
jgi:hypothetical protein